MSLHLVICDETPDPLEPVAMELCEQCSQPTSTPPLCEAHQRELDDEDAAKAWREGRYE